MIKLTDSNGRAHYVAVSAIATVCEASTSSQWHGIRAIVKLFDKTVIEASDTASEVIDAMAAKS